MHLPLTKVLSEMHVKQSPDASHVRQSIGHVITQTLFYNVYPLLHMQTDPYSAGVKTKGSLHTVQY